MGGKSLCKLLFFSKQLHHFLKADSINSITQEQWVEPRKTRLFLPGKVQKNKLPSLCPEAGSVFTSWILGISRFPGGSEGKASAYNARDPGSIPGLGRSPGEGNGNPLQYSCLENSMDGGAWWATVHGVAKSRTRLRDLTSLTLL